MRSRREELGLTAAAFSKLMGLSAATISGWETGNHPLSPERYEDASKYLKVDPKKFAKVVLRYSSPHLFDLMYPGEDKTLKAELKNLSARFFLPYGNED